MDSLGAAIDRVRTELKSLDVYTADDAVAGELKRQFSTRNVAVTHRGLPSGTDHGFVVVHDEDGTFQGALGIDALDAILSPDESSVSDVADASIEHSEAFPFLENTLFAAYDRRQMLAATREIEDRTWRIGAGELFVGFQRVAAFEEQRPRYDRFVDETDVTVRAFVGDESTVGPAAFPVVAETGAAGGELGAYWFVLFDGGENAVDACGLLAEERKAGEFFGFWTYDSDLVEELMTYLRQTHVEA